MARYDEGPHRVVVNRNQENLGLVGHVNKVAQLASGDVVFLAGGDDISLPCRVQKCMRIYENNPSVHGVWSNVSYIDAKGIITGSGVNAENLLYTFKQHLEGKLCSVMGCSTSFRKKIFDFFGPLNPILRVEDIPIHFPSPFYGRTLSSCRISCSLPGTR